MAKTIVILQSAYIPWKGYFDLMRDADEFILYDDRQYTRQDWRNRNQVKAEQGPQWLTIPVVGRFGQRIDETVVADRNWASKHWARLVQLYRRAPYFAEYSADVESIYRAAADEPLLSRVNRLFLSGIGRLLGLNTRLRWSSEFEVVGDRTGVLVELCRATGATRYVSGPAAREYLNATMFETASIDLEFKDYRNYPEYPQFHPPFAHGVSILDLLFQTGPEAPWFIWGWRDCPEPGRSH